MSTPADTSITLPAARVALKAVRAMLPPVVTSGWVPAVAELGRSSTIWPAVFNSAAAPNVNWPRAKLGAGVEKIVMLNAFRVDCETSFTLKLKLPPGAVMAPSTSMLAPTKAIAPPTGVVNARPAGKVMLPSGLLIVSAPNPVPPTKSGGSVRTPVGVKAGFVWNTMSGGVGE